jgi:hypothetical protein
LEVYNNIGNLYVIWVNLIIYIVVNIIMVN